uniref:Uncharacterized protein n=1 Tax=viral metagenome TaxID=1070528 RepID=A0A6C0KQR4_9ZZZZ
MAFLKNDDLNSILLALRNTDSRVFSNCGQIFEKDESKNEAFLISSKYITKDSVSLSDIVLADAEKYPDHKQFKVALKMWFSWNSETKTKRKSALAKLLSNEFNDDLEQFFDFFDIDVPKTKLNNKKVAVPVSNYDKKIQDEFGNLQMDILNDAKPLSLEYEARVYQFITENIIMRNVSPNFIPLITVSSCTIDEMILSIRASPLPFTRKDKLIRKMTLIKTYFPKVKLNFMMTGSSKNIRKLADVIKELNLAKNKDEIASIVFQGFHALYVMNKYKLRQGDLHFGNIFVEILDTPVKMRYKVYGNEVEFETTHILKMFDMDRGYNEHLDDNPINVDLTNLGNVNKYLPNRDFVQFVCTLLNYDVSAQIIVTNLQLVSDPKMFPSGNNAFQNEYLEIKIDDQDEIAKIEPYFKTPTKNPDVIINSSKDMFRFIPTAELMTLVNRITMNKIFKYLTQGNAELKSKLKSILVLYDKKKQTINIINGWRCQIPHDIDIGVDNIFEDASVFARLTSALSKKNTKGLPTLSYDYKPLPFSISDGLFVPRIFSKMSFSKLAVTGKVKFNINDEEEVVVQVPFISQAQGELQPMDVSSNESTYLIGKQQMSATKPILVEPKIESFSDDDEYTTTPVLSLSDKVKIYLFTSLTESIQEGISGATDLTSFLQNYYTIFLESIRSDIKFLSLSRFLNPFDLSNCLSYILTSFLSFVKETFDQLGVQMIDNCVQFSISTLSEVSKFMKIKYSFILNFYKDFSSVFYSDINAVDLATLFNTYLPANLQISSAQSQLVMQRNNTSVVKRQYEDNNDRDNIKYRM